MSIQQTFQVVLLPQMEVVQRNLRLSEATAWMQSYNSIMLGNPSRAVIAEELIAHPDGPAIWRASDLLESA